MAGRDFLLALLNVLISPNGYDCIVSQYRLSNSGAAGVSSPQSWMYGWLPYLRIREMERPCVIGCFCVGCDWGGISNMRSMSQFYQTKDTWMQKWTRYRTPTKGHKPSLLKEVTWCDMALGIVQSRQKTIKNIIPLQYKKPNFI